MRTGRIKPDILERLPIVILSITDRCNLNCSYCFKKEEMKALNELPLEDWKEIYDRYHPQMIQLFGGEPTLRWKDTLEFIEYVYRHPKEGLEPTRIAFATNGTTGVDYTDIPGEQRNNVEFCFSLDGFPMTHDKTRGKGNYEKTKKAIRQCVAAGICTGINCTLWGRELLENTESLSQFIEYFHREIGIDFMRLNAVFFPNVEYSRALTRTPETKEALLALSQLPAVKKYHVDVMDRSLSCGRMGVHIHAGGELSPRCSAIQVSYGHWRRWSEENVRRLNCFCNQISYDCNSVNHASLDRYARGLLACSGGV